MLMGAACCLPDEKTFPEPVTRPDAGVPAAEPAKQGLFEYCPNSSDMRRCNTYCAPGDIYAGWWCDQPLPWQTQLMSEDGTCWIIACDQFEPHVGFNVGGYGLVTSLFGLSWFRWQRNGSQVNTVHLTNECWEGQQFPTWGWSEIDWGPGGSHPIFKSFACSNQVSW
jgi:hypothetical protein